MASAVEEPQPVWLTAKDLECSICLSLLSNPATVQCGHSFCLSCIQEWLTGKHGNCQCPMCKCRLSDKLPERTVLLNLVLEKYNCLASSDPLPTRLAAEPAFPDGPRCKRDFSSARRAFQDYQKEILDLFDPEEKQKACLQADAVGNRELTAGLTDGRVSRPPPQCRHKRSFLGKDYMFKTRSSISKAFSFMKKCICDQEEMVLRIIEEEWKTAQQIRDSTDKQVNGKIHGILDLQNKSEETMKKTSSGQEAYIGDPIQKISNIASAVEELRRQLEASILNFPGQPYQNVEPSPGTSNSNETAADGAEETFLSCDSSLSQDSVQEASSSLSPLPSTRGRELPTISSRFSQWTSVITFDDERLGCNLELAGNKRKVRVSRNRKEYQRSSKRFRSSQVLGSPAFSEGCHYWEINTEESSTWAIGVASEDIGRNDRLGRNELSWCIECNAESISAWHNSQETKIDKDRPLRVGVYLDFPTKSLSFYSLADEETCLHKFEINAANPVYPAFWIYGLIAGECLTINDINRN
ncbi:E3 ubiquitin-protein ligase RNF135-like [Protobothrops mucrosquamatus]|uniref:E3 ubiquitin-protein ligase RNF135-like n=1 Tax=Protobothrops mucrosquamatus TaxID=103944 RepID=UPI000775F3FA|nr:E3 ubiquitin-protein ligase RNF135-like [Protobothrops mucrosquamatus]